MRAAQISGKVTPTRWLLKAEMPRVIRFKSWHTNYRLLRLSATPSIASVVECYPKGYASLLCWYYGSVAPSVKKPWQGLPASDLESEIWHIHKVGLTQPLRVHSRGAGFCVWEKYNRRYCNLTCACWISSDTLITALQFGRVLLCSLAYKNPWFFCYYLVRFVSLTYTQTYRVW